MRLNVKVIPNAKSTAVVSHDGDTMKVRITAPAVDGKANKALLQFLARHFGKKKSQIKLIKGETSRQKIIEIL